MQTATTIAAVRAAVRDWRAAGRSVALVPTMGNLHAGHALLLSRARDCADRVLASSFVNPLQFGPGEDFNRYPRTPEADARLLEQAGCDLLFAPSIEEMYPQGDLLTRVRVRVLDEILCGPARPGHFEGVATVVARLFGVVAPDVAVFGEKDYQQLLIIRRMAQDLALPVQVVSAPIVRATDGLALSSRNQYLDAAERARAPAIYHALQSTAAALQAGCSDYPRLERQGVETLTQAGCRVDYFEIRAAADLSAPRADGVELAVLAAAWVGRARLIDNLRVSPPRQPAAPA